MSAVCQLPRMSNEINNLRMHIQNLSYQQKKVLIFEYGGRGWSLSVKIVGASAPLKKRKVEKGQHPHFPATKKRRLSTHNLL